MFVWGNSQLTYSTCATCELCETLHIKTTVLELRLSSNLTFTEKVMPYFIINKNPQQNGDHEVHEINAGCQHFPNTENQIDLGFHLSCQNAVADAKTRWPNNRINGCYYCCRPCHTS